jgi:two-component system LytT family response regulator
MQKLSAIMVEDMLANREVLRTMLTDLCPQVELVGEAENVEQGYQLIKSTQPDIVFLDIQLDRETSFDLLDRLHEEDAIGFEIIFITGVGTFENVTRAIEFSALDFIHKPISEEKLVSAVEKAAKRVQKPQYNRQIELLLDILSHPTQKSRRIAFHLLKGVIEFVPVDDVVLLEADGPVTHIRLRDGTKLTAMKNLGHYSRLLTSDYDFFQISNDKVVNLDFVKRYNHAELTLTLLDGSHLIAARRGGQDLRRFLSENKAFRSIEDKGGLLGMLKQLFGK